MYTAAYMWGYSIQHGIGEYRILEELPRTIRCIIEGHFENSPSASPLQEHAIISIGTPEICIKSFDSPTWVSFRGTHHQQSLDWCTISNTTTGGAHHHEHLDGFDASLALSSPTATSTAHPSRFLSSRSVGALLVFIGARCAFNCGSQKKNFLIEF